MSVGEYILYLDTHWDNLSASGVEKYYLGNILGAWGEVLT